MQTNLNSLIEASSNEIHLWARDLSLAPEVRCYAQVLSAFLQGDVEKLQSICHLIENPVIQEIANLRLAIRRQDLKKSDLVRIGKIDMSGIFEAEKLFCLGMAWEKLDDDQMAFDSFTRAAVIYKNADCPRKSLRALYNSIAAESRLRPHKNFISDYQAVIGQSQIVGDVAFEGMALAMLSREYQLVGMLEQALQMAERSVVQLQAERGTIHYFHSLLHKAHVLLDLNRADEIIDLLKESELAPFPAISAARALLQLSLDPSLIWNRALEEDLLPTWKNRVPQLSGQRTSVVETVQISDLEQTLLRLAYNGPVEKWDLIERLYEKNANSLVLENRFKNLVARVRKKHPGVLICQQGRYSLTKPLASLSGTL